MSDTAMTPAQLDPATLIILWNTLETAIFQVQVYFAALCCIVFYEWLANLGREYRLIWKSDWTLVKGAYLLIRYTGILHAIIDPEISLKRLFQLHAYYGPRRADDCARFVTFIPAFPIVGVVLSHFIMLTQCHAVWGREPWVLIVLGPLILAEAAIMAISAFTKIVPIPLVTEFGPCLPRAVDAFPIVYFAFPMLFDLVVSVLTAVKTLKLRREEHGVGMKSSLLNTIIQQSFQYFIFITAANFTNIIYYAVDANDPMSSINGPLAIIATELFACRLTLSLRDVKGQAPVPRLVFGSSTEKEKSKRNIARVIVFGDDGADGNELSSIRHSMHSSTTSHV
ncbi:hypothetical protein P389DRAFT_204713 [Cystobasidium minutum MCA 4210]|uniref:uncharacterized protein n=1 Tax=Cystobasidium minutum MCA 4210 TaxID=1397322 RepID=UPI0034CDCA1E|eukprot:jgi/Rhomi1/204713/MIX5542_312_33